MRKTYKVVKNLTVMRPEGNAYVTLKGYESYNKKELKEQLEIWKRYGYEFIVGKKQLTVMMSGF